MRPLRVGIVAESYFPSLGGIQEHVRHLRNHLQRRGVEVAVLTGRPTVAAGPGPEDAEQGVIRLGHARTFRTGGSFTQATIGPLAPYRFYRALRQKRFDLLNIHGPCDFGLPTWALSMFRGPKVLTLHNASFPDARWRHLVAPYYRWVFRRAAAVISVSEATAQSMRRYADFAPAIIPNGIDLAYWRASPSPQYLRPGTRNLVYLGRLEARNGPEVAIEAFGAVAPRFPDVRLLVAGDGPMRDELQALVPPHLRGRVEFLGAVYHQRPELLASSSVFLLPARAVGFSIMVLEAFAAGLPVVALPALGADGAGEHWSNVVLAKGDSVAAFADAVSDTLSQEQGERIARGRAIAESYDWERIVGRILEVYQRVAEQSGQPAGWRSQAAA
ncbi:MAG: glycosyltransferase family 4 protein [Deltaproteobacteria bacterium]|jgi:phosphatidylinositol alpha-mannosyltransferase|nr:glycosyltransferase family 4 protein [Deltaproteobacteria bacterium]